MANVAKWFNAPVCGTGTRGFKTHHSPQKYNLLISTINDYGFVFLYELNYSLKKWEYYFKPKKHIDYFNNFINSFFENNAISFKNINSIILVVSEKSKFVPLRTSFLWAKIFFLFFPIPIFILNNSKYLYWFNNFSSSQKNKKLINDLLFLDSKQLTKIDIFEYNPYKMKNFNLLKWKDIY